MLLATVRTAVMCLWLVAERWEDGSPPAARRSLIRRGGGRPVRLGLAGDQVELAHQLPYEFGADLLSLTNKLGVRATIPVRVIRRLKIAMMKSFEVLAANHGGRGGAGSAICDIPRWIPPSARTFSRWESSPSACR